MMNIFAANLVSPDSFTEVAKIVGKHSNVRGFPEGDIVYLTTRNITPARGQKNLLVVGGTEEKPVRIYIESGANTVQIMSGHVHIQPASDYTNNVIANEGTTVTVEVDETSDINVSGDGTVMVKAECATNRVRDYTSKGIKILENA